MASQHSLLSHLQGLSSVDCDTLDDKVAEELGPFVDCTSNQAIAFFELSLHKHETLLKRAATLAKQYHSFYHLVPLPALAVEIGMVLLALRIVPHLSGFSHLQTNPLYSYDTRKTVLAAWRLVELMEKIGKEELEGGYDAKRVCVKIPSTWEGLVACRELEKRGIRTLATTLFTIEQAQLAAEVGCRYVAPYVNELRVHFDESYEDLAPNLSLSPEIQAYYTAHGLSTQVLPASLTSINECMALAGVHHITISPPLLRLLADTTAGSDVTSEYPSLFASTNQAADGSMPEILQEETTKKSEWLRDEAGYRLSVTRNDGGKQEVKLTQAINIFCEMQEKLEALMEGLLNS